MDGAGGPPSDIMKFETDANDLVHRDTLEEKGTLNGRPLTQRLLKHVREYFIHGQKVAPHKVLAECETHTICCSTKCTKRCRVQGFQVPLRCAVDVLFRRFESQTVPCILYWSKVVD